jgi:hypothetical protein
MHDDEEQGSKNRKKKSNIDHPYINRGLLKAKDIQDLAELCDKRGHEFNSVNVNTAFSKLAKFAKNTPEQGTVDHLMRLLSKQTLSIMRTLKPRELSGLMHAHAKIHMLPAQEILDSMDKCALTQLDEFVPQDVATMMWSYASLRTQPSEQLTQALMTQSLQTMQDFTAVNITNLLWAFAKLNIRPRKELMSDIVSQARTKLLDFTGTEMSTLLWACHKLRLDISPITWGVGEVMRRHAKTFEPSHIAISMFSIARMGHKISDQAMSAMLTEATKKMKLFTPLDQAKIMCALAIFRVLPVGEFMDAWYKRAWDVLHEYSAWEVAWTLESLASLNASPDPVFLKRISNLTEMHSGKHLPVMYVCVCLRVHRSSVPQAHLEFMHVNALINA